MEVKVACNCGQNFKFDVEPVGGRMPVPVFCPGCGGDGTQAANDVLAQHFPNQAPPIPVAMAVRPAAAIAPPPPAGRLQINLSAPAAAGAPAPLSTAPRPITAARSTAIASAASKPKAEVGFNLWLGILGAVLGAALGAGLMYGFFLWTDFRFPLMGTGIGALTGLGARILAKGTDMTLGAIAGVIALMSTAGTLYFIYGDIAALFIISMVVSVSFAYKIAG